MTINPCFTAIKAENVDARTNVMEVVSLADARSNRNLIIMDQTGSIHCTGLPIYLLMSLHQRADDIYAVLDRELVVKKHSEPHIAAVCKDASGVPDKVPGSSSHYQASAVPGSNVVDATTLVLRLSI